MARSRREFLRTSRFWGGLLVDRNAASAIRAADGPNGRLAIGCIGASAVAGPMTFRASKVKHLLDYATWMRSKPAKRSNNFRLSSVSSISAHARQNQAARCGRHWHPRSYACRRGDGGDAARQTPLLRKAAGHSLADSRAMRNMAAKTKLATQMGIQIHAEQNYSAVRRTDATPAFLATFVRPLSGRLQLPRRRAAEDRACPQRAELSLRIGPRPSSRIAALCPVLVAAVPRFWHRRTRRHGVPHPRFRFHGLGLPLPPACSTVAELPNPSDFRRDRSRITIFRLAVRCRLKLTWWTGSKRPPAELGDGEKWSGGGSWSSAAEADSRAITWAAINCSPPAVRLYCPDQHIAQASRSPSGMDQRL